MPEVKISESGRNSKSSSLSRQKELYDSKIIIHGRFHLKSDHALVASEAYAYVHMNNQERLMKQAVSEKAIFKFYEDHLRVTKPNVFSSVKESKYPYDNIEKFFVFSDYPKIVVFCIKMPTYRLAFLFECPSDDSANKACNIVEDYKVRHRSPDENTISDRTSEPSSSEDVTRRRPGGVIMKGGTFEGRSPSDSYSGDDGPGILHSQSFERQSYPPQNDTPTRKQLSVLQRGEFGNRLSPPTTDRFAPNAGRLSPNMGRPVSVNSDVFRSGSLERSRPTSPRPRSMMDGGPTSRPIINISYDRSLDYNFSGSESPRPGAHNHGFRHKREQRAAAYPVSVLGRYRVNDPREDFEMDNAQTYLNICLNNPRTAADKGELQLYSDCMKLVAMDPGHYDYNNIYRIYCFEADPTVLIFGLREKNKFMYMLLRFKSQEMLSDAFGHITSRGDYKEFSDFKLSDRQRGTYHQVNGNSSIDRMSKTIALPSEKEIETKRISRQSYSSNSVGSQSTVEEDRIVGARMQGVHAAPPQSSRSSDKNYEVEFTTLLNQMEREQSSSPQYINSVIVDEVDDNRTTHSAMYLEREERTTRRSPDYEDRITASVSTRVESSYTPAANELYVDHRRGSTQWVEEASYIDYKPGTGVVESDNGPVYMYCARQVRKENYAL